MTPNSITLGINENTKTPFCYPPSKVIYSLTDFGKSLIPTLNVILAWGNQIGGQRGRIY
nr:winged helix-turn-helix transcriptional regulator [Mucilaginibacter aquariorum]